MTSHRTPAKPRMTGSIVGSTRNHRGAEEKHPGQIENVCDSGRERGTNSNAETPTQAQIRAIQNSRLLSRKLVDYRISRNEFGGRPWAMAQRGPKAGTSRAPISVTASPHRTNDLTPRPFRFSSWPGNHACAFYSGKPKTSNLANCRLRIAAFEFAGIVYSPHSRAGPTSGANLGAPAAFVAKGLNRERSDYWVRVA